MFSRVFGALALLGAFAFEARADNAELQHAQTGALLGYADFEARFMFTVLTSRELDPAAIKAANGEMKRTIEDAKKSVDRTVALLSEAQAKIEPDLKKLRDDLKKAGDQLERFNKDFGEQSKLMKVEEEPSDEIAAPAGSAPKEEGGAQPNWELLKSGAGWLYDDLSVAQADAKKLAAKLAPKLKAPPKPKGTHPE